MSGKSVYDFTKDVTWENDQQIYVIHNVPVKVYGAYGTNIIDFTFDSETVMKLFTLKDLMESKEIPSEIDFSKADDIK